MIILDGGKSLEKEQYLSGRVIFFKGDTAGRNYQEGEQCAFYCGPESETEGMLSDYESVNDIMNEAFEGSGLNIDIGASESHHIIWYDSTKSFEEVWEIVKNRLIPLGFIEID